MTPNTDNNLPFEPNAKIFRWGPVPLKFLYVSTFAETHYKHFRAKYGENWSESLWLFRGGRSLYLNDERDLQAAGGRVFVRYMLPRAVRVNIYKQWQETASDLVLHEKKIDAASLPLISDQELAAIWSELNERYIAFWVECSPPELGNYGSIAYLEEKLKLDIPNDGERASALEALTAPTRLSFYQEEEIALSQTSDIEKHQKAFFWLKNSYAGTSVLPVEFFVERKKTLSKKIESGIRAKLEQTILRNQSVQKQYGLSDEIMDIAEAIRDGVGWQDERKKHIFILLHYIDLLVQEVARRFSYNFDELHNLWHSQIGGIIQGKDLHAELGRRENGFGVRYFHDCDELSSGDVEYFWNLYGNEKIVEGVKEVKGIVASKGKESAVEGKVHILLDPNNLADFQDGEILVAPMTSPEYVFAMKKARAVVTDAGGLTSHAAIVSRELGIPCIVGTKVATAIFANGDVINVDTKRGVAWKR